MSTAHTQTVVSNMKNLSILTIIFYLFLSISVVKGQEIIEDLDGSREDFKIFLEDFSKVEKFQKSRVIFPFEDCTTSDFHLIKCVETETSEWHYLKLLPELNPPLSIINIYDNFDLEVKRSGERVLAFEANDTNVCVYYYFKLIENKWYLIKRVTCTDE